MDYFKSISEREFRTTTGFSTQDFQQLLVDFEVTFFNEYQQSYPEYIEENVTSEPKFKTLEACLYLVLFQLKNKLLFETLAFAFRMRPTTVQDNYNKFLPLLEKTLENKEVMPARKFETVTEFESHLAGAEEVLIDGTEQQIERPKDNETQRNQYSGKKKAHTNITLVISDKKRYIYYISPLYKGRNVDLGILKKEFPPEQDWFSKMKVMVDLGFIGIDKLYKIKELWIGFKKKRKSKSNPNPELNEEQKSYNKEVSRERIYVEHAIGGMKIFRILKGICRIKNQQMRNRIVGICAGLWNYKLLCKTN